MYQNLICGDASEALPLLFEKLLHEGDEHTSRAGLVKELTHVGITLTCPWRRELLVTGRRPSLAAQIAESAWVLAGRDDLEFLGHYLPRAYDFSDDGETWRAGYGKRLRHWHGDEGNTIDQLDYVFQTLKATPISRQAVMSIWDPAFDTTPSKDIPCNNWLSFSSRLGKLDLMVAIRSNDAMWGWSGINAFEWSVVQEVLAGLLGIGVGGLHFATTSLHLYGQHWAKAREVVDQNGQVLPPLDSPRFDATKLVSRDVAGLDDLMVQFFRAEAAIRTHSPAAADLVDVFPEPMFQSWLRVLQWWWTGDESFLEPLGDTRIRVAAKMSLQPPARELVELRADDEVVHVVDVAQPVIPEIVHEDIPVGRPSQISPFLQGVFLLHGEKHTAYGDSWKRRGEMLGIMANIARKVDRLGGSETEDESSVDTAIDLMVYLAKYRVWLEDQASGGHRSDDPEPADDRMAQAEMEWLFSPTSAPSVEHLEAALRSGFDQLEKAVMAGDPGRGSMVDEMILDSYVLARSLWKMAKGD